MRFYLAGIPGYTAYRQAGAGDLRKGAERFISLLTSLAVQERNAFSSSKIAQLKQKTAR